MADIGSTLREARMRARIDITEVETRTKIRARYLRALENEEWDLLPGSVYAKSFLRTYGDFLGLDSRMLVDEYRRRYEHPSDNDLRPLQTLGRERERSARGPLIAPWMWVALVLVAVVAVLFVIGSLGSTSKPTPPAVSQPVIRTPSHRRHHRHRTAPTSTVHLQLTPTGAIYMCLVNGAGVKLINQQTFAAGQSIPVQTGTRLLLTLGNNAVQVRINGHTLPVAPSAQPIRLLITPTSEHSIPLATTPTCP